MVFKKKKTDEYFTIIGNEWSFSYGTGSLFPVDVQHATGIRQIFGWYLCRFKRCLSCLSLVISSVSCRYGTVPYDTVWHGKFRIFSSLLISTLYNFKEHKIGWLSLCHGFLNRFLHRFLSENFVVCVRYFVQVLYLYQSCIGNEVTNMQLWFSHWFHWFHLFFKLFEWTEFIFIFVLSVWYK